MKVDRWPVGKLACWHVTIWLAGRLASSLAGWLIDLPARELAAGWTGWHAGRLAGSPARQQTSWLAG